MRRLFFILLTLSPYFSVSQKTVLYYHLDKITIKEKTVKDSTRFERYQKNALKTFRLNGYTGITLKDSVAKNNGTHYYYQAAHHFKKIILRRKHPSKEKFISDENRDFQSTLKELEDELRQLENSGFPFAKIEIIQQEEREDKLLLDYEIDSGDYFEISVIHLKSEDPFHDKTLLNIIDLSVDEAYNESEIIGIGSLLSASKLYKLIRPVEVLFRKGKAELYIYFEKTKSSAADGYIGFQQDQITNKLVLNGFVNLQLYNALNRAEIIDMHWKSNPDKTQNLRSQLSYPFLFNTPFGIGGKLDLRKQDSTFLRTDITLNLSYYHPYVRFSVFDQLESSSTLRENAPSEFRNYQKNTIGSSVELIAPELQALPFYHPRLFLLGGFYNYRKDTLDDELQKLTNSKYEIAYQHTIDFLKYFHLNNTVKFQGLTSGITLSRNELIYFGGLQSVRGFYELELFGNDIWSSLNELEFQPIDLLSLFILYDYSAFKNNGMNHTNSFGLGFSLNNEGSSLQIIVANGVLNSNPLELSNTKIHIGFKSTF
ncbi:MAG: ShlB/FhaC/HecB family hemolysin secretion/activation protein [Crocinitomicaceae bacterium]